MGKLITNMEQKLMENRVRSALKSVSFRSIATLTTMVLVLVFTRDAVVSFEIGAIEFFGKIGLYYFHERLWNTFHFGMRVDKDKEDVV